MKLKYIVEVMYDHTEEIEKTVDCGNDLRKAERMRDSLSINLDHNNYTIFITIKEDK